MTSSIVSLVITAAGGLAMFMLAMLMMTAGLKTFAGAGLKQLLGRWTRTPVRGVAAGMLVTGIVQSSSAVTVATIGFVNAGVLSLRQALGVIFGTNVGTTVTAWLVSLVGFGVKIELFALPLLAAGVALRLAAADKRRQGLGEALAGFGLFFLGLALLKDAFAAAAVSYGAAVADGGALPQFLLAGFVVTVLTQSSSAALAIILTAAAGGMIGIEPAAAAVIGANLGTTSTAVLAVLKATPAARRLAAGHVVFNLVAAAVALALLPVLLLVVARLAVVLEVDGSPAAFLALFHTLFNLLGVALLLPFTERLAAALERRFRSAEEDLSRPRHLDSTLATVPSLAVGALRAELVRLRALVADLARGSATGSIEPPLTVERRAEAIRSLVAATVEFVARVRTESMSRAVGDELAAALRIARYLDEAARLAPRTDTLRDEAGRCSDPAAHRALTQLLAAATACIMLAQRADAPPGSDTERSDAAEHFERCYQSAKATVLAATVEGRIPVDAADAQLDALSATRRLIGQLVKADRMLRSPGSDDDIEAETDPPPAGTASGVESGRGPAAQAD